MDIGDVFGIRNAHLKSLMLTSSLLVSIGFVVAASFVESSLLLTCQPGIPCAEKGFIQSKDLYQTELMATSLEGDHRGSGR